MGKKGSQFFQEKIGATPSVAAPGDTNPSDATDFSQVSPWMVSPGVASRPPLVTPLWPTSVTDSQKDFSKCGLMTHAKILLKERLNLD